MTGRQAGSSAATADLKQFSLMSNDFQRVTSDDGARRWGRQNRWFEEHLFSMALGPLKPADLTPLESARASTENHPTTSPTLKWFCPRTP